MNKVKMQLVGTDGNAYSILGNFQRAARKQGWSKDQINKVMDEATSGDYDNLLRVIMENVEEPDTDSDEDDL